MIAHNPPKPERLEIQISGTAKLMQQDSSRAFDLNVRESLLNAGIVLQTQR